MSNQASSAGTIADAGMIADSGTITEARPEISENLRASSFDRAILNKYLAPAIIAGLMAIVGGFFGVTFNLMAGNVNQVRVELKEDIQQLRTELKEDIWQLRTELKEDNQQLRTELKEDIKELKDGMKNLNLKLDRLLSQK